MNKCYWCLLHLREEGLKAGEAGEHRNCERHKVSEIEDTGHRPEAHRRSKRLDGTLGWSAWTEQLNAC